MKGTVAAVNISAAKGTVKRSVPAARITAMGLENDAHAGPWHRQVSLLAREQIDDLSAQTAQSFAPGDFAENITTAGVDLRKVAIRDRIRIGEVELEVTQIGKECHGSGCDVFRAVGRCIMPTDGLFARVLAQGELHLGDRIEVVHRPLRCQVVTLSDRAFHGVYDDAAGPAVVSSLHDHFKPTRWTLDVQSSLLPDEADRLRQEVQNALDGGADIIITTGGTGIGPRDITPETLRPLLDKDIPGIMDVIRVRYAPTIPSAALSRSLAGVSGSTLVYALPGSVKAVKEYMEEILKSLEHALMTLWDIDVHRPPPEPGARAAPRADTENSTSTPSERT